MVLSALGRIIDIRQKREQSMFNIFKKSTNEFKIEQLETCISCNNLIVDNPYYEITFKDDIRGVSAVCAHYSIGRKGCYILENIKKKMQYSTYLTTGIKYTTDMLKKDVNCFTCNMPIKDNESSKIFFKNTEGKIFSIQVHDYVESKKDCMPIMDIINKFADSKYIGIGRNYKKLVNLIDSQYQLAHHPRTID